MCSVGDEVDENSEIKCMTTKQKVNLLGSRCNKCTEGTPCVVLHGKDTYCRECFITGTVHKFKALLGKHRLIRPNDLVLIQHEPGHASAALLHFLRSGLDLDTPKKLRFRIVFLFVDKYGTLSSETRKELKENVAKQLKSFNFPIYFISFYEYIQKVKSMEELLSLDPNTSKPEDDDLENLKTKIDINANATNRNEVLNILEQELLVAAAKELFCQVIFTPELSVEIASRLLTNVSLGRGSHIPLDTGFCDVRHPGLKVLRPLRGFEAKELAFYNVYNNIETVHIPTIQDSPFQSVQGLMRKFVNDLQVNYPSTVATVVRTGDKLTVNKKVTTNKRCGLCRAPLQLPTNELTAKKATEISQSISTQNVCEAASGSALKPLDALENDKKTKQYCYRCSQIMEFIK